MPSGTSESRCEVSRTVTSAADAEGGSFPLDRTCSTTPTPIISSTTPAATAVMIRFRFFARAAACCSAASRARLLAWLDWLGPGFLRRLAMGGESTP
ncbi:MAG: hypothetical protein L0H26_07535 [Microlunatus sp.]|nr:hypothetical protein [Microlunatus sp.]